MSWFICDVESDGPCPGLYSMVSFGAVKVDRFLDITFYGKTAPLTADALRDVRFEPEALAVSGTTREEHLTYPHPIAVMENFFAWVKANNTDGNPVFISDNPAFDWQFINWYFHKFVGKNPFGFSARRIGDLYAGLMVDVKKASEWKKFRVTKHTHNPVDDAKGNAEALIAMHRMGLEIPGVVLVD